MVQRAAAERGMQVCWPKGFDRTTYCCSLPTHYDPPGRVWLGLWIVAGVSCCLGCGLGSSVGFSVGRLVCSRTWVDVGCVTLVGGRLPITDWRPAAGPLAGLVKL